MTWSSTTPPLGVSGTHTCSPTVQRIPTTVYANSYTESGSCPNTPCPCSKESRGHLSGSSFVQIPSRLRWFGYREIRFAPHVHNERTALTFRSSRRLARVRTGGRASLGAPASSGASFVWHFWVGCWEVVGYWFKPSAESQSGLNKRGLASPSPFRLGACGPGPGAGPVVVR
jgi:hypothetical protein